MIRGLLSIVSLLIIAASLIVLVPLMILPNTFLHQVVPVLAPLHQALACTSGETIRYQTFNDMDGYDTHYRCVDAAGNERNVDDVLRRPAMISMGTLCFGVLLMFVPLYFTVRQGMRVNSSPEMQAVLQQSIAQMRQSFTETGQSRAPETVAQVPATESLTQQLQALEHLLQQGMISQSDYDLARRKILDSFDQ